MFVGWIFVLSSLSRRQKVGKSFIMGIGMTMSAAYKFEANLCSRFLFQMSSMLLMLILKENML